MNDWILAFQYIAVFYVAGLGFYPLSRYIFKKLPDQGWALSKIIGIVFSSWLMWVFSSIHLAQFNLLNSWFIVIASSSLIWVLSKRFLPSPQEKPNALNIYVNEVIFLAIFFGWSYMRGFSPNINGLEKFMDYGFLLSILRTDYFPPADHFLAGESINYYYFGHYIAAFVTRIAHVPAEYGYNFQMSTIFAISSGAVFSLVSGLITNTYEKAKSSTLQMASILGGLITIVLMNFGGNLHAFVYFFQDVSKYWYPDATRFIENTIHEFPIYSFIVNDLHAHVSNIPTVIVVISAIYMLHLSYQKQKTTPVEEGTHIKALLKSLWPSQKIIGLFVFIGFMIGVSYPTNAWDFAIYLVLTGFVMWYGQATRFSVKELFKPLVLIKTATLSSTLLSLAIIVVIPFWITVKPISQGIGIVPLFESSPFWQLAIIWGVHVPLAIAYVLWLFRSALTPQKVRNAIVKTTANLFSVNIDMKNITTDKQKSNIDDTDRFILFMCLLALILIILPEVIYIRDIYPTHYRANTMFKFGYQTWILLSIVGGYSIIRLWKFFNAHNSMIVGKVYQLLSLILLFASCLYFFAAISQGLSYKGEHKSINGISYLYESNPEDAEAIDWLNKNILNQPTIVEAVGESYTEFARISSNTGLPTVLGWPVHEWLWRGSYSDPMIPPTNIQKATGMADTVAKRKEDVQSLYEANSVEVAQNLINYYGIEYIYLGAKEYESYEINLDVLKEVTETAVYDTNDVVILKTTYDAAQK